MRNNRTIYSIIIALFMVVISSCQKDEEIGGTAVQKMSGEWWIQVKNAAGTSFPYGATYFHFATYNTAANLPTEMWLDDMHSFWDFKGKVNVDINAMTFSVTNAQNTSYNSKFTVTDGKVIVKGAKGPTSKAVTDSIYFKGSFDDDTPGTVYTFTGYRRTRYAEDDH